MNDVLDEQDKKIERGDEDPTEDECLYPKGVLNVLGMAFRNKKLQRPRGKKSPKFSFEEVQALVDLLFFRSPHVVLKVYERMPKRKEMPLKRRVFLKHLLGDAKFNATQAARMAGYSPRSAKQIAHKIMRS